MIDYVHGLTIIYNNESTNILNIARVGWLQLQIQIISCHDQCFGLDILLDPIR
jgi:hypothetical protein